MKYNLHDLQIAFVHSSLSCKTLLCTNKGWNLKASLELKRNFSSFNEFKLSGKLKSISVSESHREEIIPRRWSQDQVQGRAFLPRRHVAFSGKHFLVKISSFTSIGPEQTFSRPSPSRPLFIPYLGFFFFRKPEISEARQKWEYA